MYKLKQKFSDFIVKEVFSPEIKKKGDYTYFILEKENYNTMDAVKTIASKLRIPLSRFGFAGNKDKKAQTTQYISVKSLSDKKKEQLSGLKLKDIKIKIVGQSETPISLGDHSGNEFKIRITNLTTEDKLKLKQKLKDKKKIQFIDSFGEQRFGRNNVQVGKAILRREWEKACKLVKNEDVDAHLKKHPKDFINALRKIPKKIISIYIHAYQSLIWNKCSEILDVDKIPIIGFSTEFKDKITEHHVLGLMKKDKIELKSFIIREIPNLYLEGDERNKYAIAHNVRLIEEGKDYAILKFRLGTGSYATEFIRQLFE
ncbi:tRNA pseudouridine(13) synthase TruD [Candidatus Woesearchaeota archaeon]|nr:tRNA pseudouridine(13) synthase TruD [Candidatus Woesearchaeota archaeon]